MPGLLEAALDYASRGWPVFPCRADKTPRTPNGVIDATTDAGVIREWWERWPGANVAVNCGEADLLVLDFDSYKDVGDISEALAEKLGEEVRATKLVARTPRGGEHFFYRLPEGAEPVPNSASTLAKGADVRSFNGYVLLPPSKTADGSYAWVSEGRPAAAQEALVEACRKGRRERSDDADEWIIEPDLPENRDAAIEWLEHKARLAIEGEGGDTLTYGTAAMMRSYGLSEGTALEVLWEHWNERCVPPWEYEDLAVKTEHAYRHAGSAPGNLTPAYKVARTASMFKPVRREIVGDGKVGHEIVSGRFRFVNRDGLEAVKPPKWLLDDFLSEGAFGMLVGARSSLKTFIALDAALTIAVDPFELDEDEWKGFHALPDKPGHVLYIAGEGRTSLRQRVRAWESLHCEGRPQPRFILGDPVPRALEDPDSLKLFIDGALGWSPRGYRLVVLDTISRSMQGADENSQKDASSFVAMVQELQRGLDAAVLAVHHTGHGAAGRGRGSSDFEGNADMVTVATRLTGPHSKLVMTKQKDAPEWQEPNWVTALNIQLGLDDSEFSNSSLAVVRTREEEKPEEVSRETGKGGNGKTSVSVVHQYVMGVLEEHPHEELTDNGLASLVEVYRPWVSDEVQGEPLGVTAQTISKTWLPRVRAEGLRAERYWDPSKKVRGERGAKGTWRYSPPVDEED